MTVSCRTWIIAILAGTTAAQAAQPPVPALRWPLGPPDQPLSRQMVSITGTRPTTHANPDGGKIVFPNAGRDSLWMWQATLVPPTTGDYRFFIAADDAGTLWLSDDATLARRRIVANTPQWTDRNQWDRYPSQQSKPIRLEQGKRYAIQMIWTNRGSVGHASAGWQPPGASKPEPLPLLNPDGSQLLESIQPAPDDSDLDGLPDAWELGNGLKVEKGNGDNGGFGDPDGDGLTNQEEYLLGSRPDKREGIPGYATFDVWRNPPPSFLYVTSPEQLPSLLPAKLDSAAYPLDKLPVPVHASVWRLRCILKAPENGYYRLAAEAAGCQQILLSDDGTPNRLRQLWRDGALWEDHQPGFKDRRLRLESPWVYFTKGEPRYLEIRHIHSPNGAFANLAWTGEDGVRRNIPPSCISSDPEARMPLAATDGSDLSDTLNAKWIGIDLRSAKALTTGWSYFGPGSAGWFDGRTLNKRKLPDRGLSTNFGGSVEIPFTTNKAGHHELMLDAQICSGGKLFAHFNITREIDGITFGRELLFGRDGHSTTFRVSTPWLKPGSHKLRLHLSPDRNPASFRILTLGLRALADEPAALSENAFLPARGEGGFLISPACVEIASRTSAPPVVKANGKSFATREAMPGVWWTDVALPESGKPLTLTASFPADRIEKSANARWMETSIHTMGEIHVRSGDSLRLTAWREGADAGATAVVTARGKDTPTPAGKPLVLRFDKPGDETLTAVFTPVAGEPLKSALTVHVVPLSNRSLTADWTRTDGVSELSSLPEGAWPDGGDAAAFRRDEQGKWWIAPRVPGEWPAVVRAGPVGPVLGSIRVRGIELGPMLRNYSGEEEKMNGSPDFRDIAGHYAILRGLPEGWKVAFDQSAYEGHPWDYILPNNDPQRPFHREVYPWRCGNCAVAEFWFRHNGNPESYLPGDFSLIPPANGHPSK